MKVNLTKSDLCACLTVLSFVAAIRQVLLSVVLSEYTVQLYNLQINWWKDSWISGLMIIVSLNLGLYFIRKTK